MCDSVRNELHQVVSPQSRVWRMRIPGITAVVVAAIVLAGLVLCTQSTSSITFADVTAAYGRAQNVHVISSCPDTGDVAYELWVSRELGFAALTTAQEQVVYDLAARQKRRADLASARTECRPLSDEEYAGVLRMADCYPGPMLTRVSSDARWSRVSGPGDQEVYELAWMNSSEAGHAHAVRYEVVIDGVTKLPQVLRGFQNGPVEAGWKCTSQVTYEYLTGAQMKSAAENGFFCAAPMADLTWARTSADQR